eukprot:TRINITY_DN15632_c0_g1_i1.p3 TRINITY_DN15632_c0_g1~~TRINITY_DN15632_c0_g1_i1.p3  ORF type:complete len:117 (-),score=8.68 TRINITY_DN15632_c0_g1_i1:197-547(-)
MGSVYESSVFYYRLGAAVLALGHTPAIRVFVAHVRASASVEVQDAILADPAILAAGAPECVAGAGFQELVCQRLKFLRVAKPHLCWRMTTPSEWKDVDLNATQEAVVEFPPNGPMR